VVPSIPIQFGHLDLRRDEARHHAAKPRRLGREGNLLLDKWTSVVRLHQQQQLQQHLLLLLHVCLCFG